MSSSFRRLVLVLIMLGLPLQGALAAIMPLCAQIMQARDSDAAREAVVHSPSSIACSQHDADYQPQLQGNDGNTDAAFVLSCDGVVCHISGTGLPPAAAGLNVAVEFSYAAWFNSRFTSSILPQPQRPPLT
ncbi:MAG TPA: hypothetical protein VL380_05610 [Nitrosospira sp.]|nr:hypothetical protein [Nitrosospira sp.]